MALTTISLNSKWYVDLKRHTNHYLHLNIADEVFATLNDLVIDNKYFRKSRFTKIHSDAQNRSHCICM